MRMVLAPDAFAGSATADEAANIFAEGWREIAPDVDIDLVPMSDGGPGLIDALALAASHAPTLGAAFVHGPTGVSQAVLHARIGGTAFVESALACGLDLVREAAGDVRSATTYGVGELMLAAAAGEDVDTVVVGLGGSGSNDGGAGVWAALGAEPADLLRGGGVALRELRQVTSAESPQVRLIAATDVDNPLLGPQGASVVYGPQKGADEAAVRQLEAGLERWADVIEATVSRPGLRDVPGAGAAGGLGFALLALGAEVVSGTDMVIDYVGLRDRVATADLVVTGEGRFDATSLRGKVVSGVARVAQAAGVPCVVAAGEAAVGAREAAAYGVAEVFSVTQLLGSPEAALAAGQDGIRELGRAVARTWSSAARGYD